MKLTRFVREDRAVEFDIELKIDEQQDVEGKVHVSSEERTSRVKEAPLPECDEAVQKLMDVVRDVMQLGNPYKKGVTVRSVRFEHTLAGSRSMQVVFYKTLLGKPHRQKTPWVHFDQPQEGETFKLETKYPELCAEAYDLCLAYAQGDRQQMLLDLPPGNDGSPEQTGEQQQLV